MSEAARDGVAIIGMSCMFPGAPDLDAYWQNILNKVDAVTDPPPEAWDTDTYYDPAFADTDKVYCKRGGYLGSLVSFDPLQHGIPPIGVGGEPDQWLALQLAQDALADAGCTDLPTEVRERTAIVLGKGTYLNGGNAIAVQRGLIVEQTLELVGRLHPEWRDDKLELLRHEMKRALPPIRPETVSGLIPNVIVGRIANRLDLMGPNYTVDAACASSLVAVQLAMRDLLDGACDLALAGGSQVWMPVPSLNVFCQLGALSRREQIRPFDKEADGTLLGEGIGMVVLKRAADAARDGDRMYAVIKGVGVASDGRGVGVMAPRIEGEELALRRAYDQAGVSPSTIGLIEAHGTATPVGDVVEVQALSRIFERDDGTPPRCALGTVKSMISHTMPAAGIAGLIKVGLALNHRVLPPTLHCSEPNPELELEKTPFYINTETRPWVHGGPEPRRAGINAFGFGGINAHAVLEEVPGGWSEDHLPPWDSEVCILESDSPQGLVEQATRLTSALEADSASFSLTDLAYTLSCELGRSEEPVRLAVVATALADLKQKLERALERLTQPGCRRIKGVSGIYFSAEPLAREGKVVLLFPGEGAQYPNMLADLCLYFPEVREAFDRIDRTYFDHPRGHLASDWIFPRPAFSEEEQRRAERRLMQMDTAVESVLTANEAVHALLRRLGVRADACVGHSTGELSAAFAAGALELDTEERLAAFSQAMYRYYSDAMSRDDVPRALLLAIAAERERVEAIAREAGGELYVAMDNCPHQAVVVGETEAVTRAREIAARAGLIHEELPYDRAVHTPLFAPFADDLHRLFSGVEIAPPQITLYSCTTAAPYPTDPAEIRELLVEHWTHPVEFRRTIETLYAEDARVFVEAGPRGNLTAFVEDILRGRDFCAVAADVQRRSGITQINHLVGMLAAHDVDLDVTELYAHRNPRRIQWQEGRRTSTPAHPDSKIGLAMAWPMLRLPEDVIDGVRDGPPLSPPTQPPAEPLPRAPEPLPGDSDGAVPVSAVMDTHLETMEQFLATQEELLQVYFAGAQPAEGDSGVAVLPEDRPATAGPRQIELTYPLLGTVVSWTPSEELVAQRVFDPAEDLYLSDHTLGRGVSTTDQELEALALMPLTMSVEVLAEAAACLVPERRVTGIRDLHAHRWLAWEGEPQTLQITARRLSDGGREERVLAQLRNFTEDAESENVPRSPVVEATVVLEEAYPDPPATEPAKLPDGRRSRWSPDRLYSEVMFHGPCWQAVRAIEETGSKGVVARLQVLPSTRFFRSTPHPPLVLDPVVLDAAGQVIGFWTAEHLTTGDVIFPFRLDALEVYGPRRPAGEELRCSAVINLVGEQLVRSDIDVIGADGRPWMRLRGWEDKRFDVSSRFRPLILTSHRGAISSRWPEPIARFGEGRLLECRRLSAGFRSDRALWKRIWAGRVLSRAERGRFHALRVPEPRQLEWLGARTAAKEAVQELVRACHGLDLLPADIEIDADELGRPLVGGSWLGDIDAVPIVSLAHTGGSAVALAGLAAPQAELGTGVARVGIDVEYLRPRSDGFAELTFTTEERQRLESLGPDLVDEWMLRCWCAKEAVAKAVGSGLIRGPQEVSAVAIHPESGRIEVQLRGDLANAHPELVNVPLVTYSLKQDDLVVATTLCEPSRE
jgi:phosphopantetheine--protein transferase-like protein